MRHHDISFLNYTNNERNFLSVFEVIPISAATGDRLLKDERLMQQKGISTTRKGSLLKKSNCRNP